jgi:DNA-binding NtrC family response regulator
MQSPVALILDDDASARESASDALTREGVPSLAVASPREAVELLRRHPSAVIAMVDSRLTPPRIAQLKALARLRGKQGEKEDEVRLSGKTEAAGALRRQVEKLAESNEPVLFVGEPGSGRSHAARWLHSLTGPSDPFAVLVGADAAAIDKRLASAEGTLFIPSIEDLPWQAQESLAAALANRKVRARVIASTSLDPRAAADEGRLFRALVAAFSDATVRVPALRERSGDAVTLARAFVDELCRLNGLPPITLAPDAESALASYSWPGNLRQLRSAVESAVILAENGVVAAKDLPEYLRASHGGAPPAARADRKFREAKRTVVEAFERAYLEDLLKRHRGNVTGAAEHSGMLRSALQRLLRKHELHSADFRTRGAPGPYTT